MQLFLNPHKNIKEANLRVLFPFLKVGSKIQLKSEPEKKYIRNISIDCIIIVS